jgi:hypothetical protein
MQMAALGKGGREKARPRKRLAEARASANMDARAAPV